MLRARIELTVYADEAGEIDPFRVQGVLDQARSLGYDTAPVEYVPPVEDTDTGKVSPWGLRIVGEDDDA
jgi:hypothetical protein